MNDFRLSGGKLRPGLAPGLHRTLPRGLVRRQPNALCNRQIGSDCSDNVICAQTDGAEASESSRDRVSNMKRLVTRGCRVHRASSRRKTASGRL